MKILPKNFSTSSKHRSLYFMAIDLCALIATIAMSFFLTFYLTQSEFPDTNYQDWMFHAFRIESLDKYGLTSWDHIWSSGINYWRSYQYTQHLLVLGVSKVFGLTIPNAMLWTVSIAFILMRVETYLLLRRLKVAPIYAFFTIVISFAFIQQWVTLKDFSIFVVLPTLPLFLYLWIKSLQQPKFMPLLCTVAGLGWILHPILGYSWAGLVAFAVIFPLHRPKIKDVALYILLYFSTWSAFLIPYLFYGYMYSNPIYSLPQFLRETLIKEAYGLSVPYGFAIMLSWVTLLADAEHFKRWSKILLLYCMLYFAAIRIGQAGYLPSVINQLQISRGMVVIGYMLPFVFGIMVQTLGSKIETRFKIGLFAVFTALLFTQGIRIEGQYGPNGMQEISNPVSIYFEDKPNPTGTVFTENVSEASFATIGKIRFPNSYNEHLEPHPLAQRFRRLIKTDLSYSSLSKTQIELIDAYVKTLGVEFIFMPKYSPTVNQLVDQGETKQFERVGEVSTQYESFAIIRNIQPIHYGYMADQKMLKENISFKDFTKPGIRVDAFQDWDAEIKKYSELIVQKDVTPLNVKFTQPNILSFTVPTASGSAEKSLLITQSYDPYWKVEIDGKETNDISIQPTSLRFMFLDLPTGLQGKTITLRHEWPNWYWPVQGVAIAIGVLFMGGYTLFYSAKYLKESLQSEKALPQPVKPKFKPIRLTSSLFTTDAREDDHENSEDA